MSQKDLERRRQLHRRIPASGRSRARRCAGGQRRARPAGHRRLAGARQAAPSAGPHERRQARSSRSARSAAIRRSGWPARCRPDGKVVTLELDPHHAEVARANLERAGLSELVDLRVGPALESLAALACRGRRAVRFHLHRRRQAEQPELSVVGDAAVAAGHGHHLRQRHPRRRGAGRGWPRRQRRRRACGVFLHRRRGQRLTARPSRPSAPRAMTVLPLRSSVEQRSRKPAIRSVEERLHDVAPPSRKASATWRSGARSTSETPARTISAKRL